MAEPTGGAKTVDLDETYVAFIDGTPVVLQIENEDQDLFFPVFSSLEALEEGLATAGVPYDSIKQLENGREFFLSLPATIEGHRVRVIIDVYQTPEGKSRWYEILMN